MGRAFEFFVWLCLFFHLLTRISHRKISCCDTFNIQWSLSHISHWVLTALWEGNCPRFADEETVTWWLAQGCPDSERQSQAPNPGRPAQSPHSLPLALPFPKGENWQVFDKRWTIWQISLHVAKSNGKAQNTRILFLLNLLLSFDFQKIKTQPGNVIDMVSTFKLSTALAKDDKINV